MVVVAVPLGAMRAVFERIRDAVDNDAVITDVGSAKGSVVAAAAGRASARASPGSCPRIPSPEPSTAASMRRSSTCSSAGGSS